ncbi:MAG: NACHT domain-containing protein [Elainellaceae cyanobacterium]
MTAVTIGAFNNRDSAIGIGMANSLWTFLNTDIKDLFTLDTLNESVDAASTVMDLAETLEEQEVQDISPWVEQGASLLEVLNTPEAELIESILPFAKIATGLLKFYLKTSQKPLTFSECVVLVCLKAYSESLAGFLTENSNVLTTGNSGKSIQAGSISDDLKRFELTEAEANRTLLCFHQSKLAQHLKGLMMERSQQAGIDDNAAHLLTERAAWNTHRYITKAWSELPDEKRRFNVNSLAEWSAEQEKYESIDTYLKEYVSPNPDDPTRKMRWQVFNEPFTLQEIYVPLNAQLLTRNGDEDTTQESIDLETWAQNLLDSPHQQNQVLFIQAGPGRGKSVFCRIFANKVRESLFPIWIPILIRLRDIPKLQNSFVDTLREAISTDFARNDDGWLTDKNTRFLFFLDGFDELLMEGRTSGGLEQFLRQVGQFQQSCTSPEMGHRVIVTGRPLALQGVERTLPQNLERVKILPMDDERQHQWFVQWGKLVDAEPQHLATILNDQRLPERVRELAREPLLLYLLAAMHRDGELHLDMFAGAEESKAKVLIYQKTLDWVLTKQRPDLLNRDLTEFETDGLKRILAEAGLYVIQSGGESASIRMIEERLRTDDNARNLLDEAQTRLKENPLRNALAAFYLQPGRKGEGSVEFAHKSFSEFLCAKRLKLAIEDWTYPGRRNQFELSDEQLHWEIYDLLGAPVLTVEIVSYLMELLKQSNDFRPVELFNRLHDFYLRWCDGEFIDQLPANNLPQKKMLQLQEFDSRVGLRKVDVYGGINILILLLKLHSMFQLDATLEVSKAVPSSDHLFYPCSKPESNIFDEDRLLKIIYYAYAVKLGSFNKIVGPHLANAYLVSAYLGSAFLYEINLTRANLSKANFKNARLCKTNFDSAVLSGAILAGADLKKANLNGSNLSHADLENISWDEDTNWNNVQGLETAKNLPEALKRQLGLEA